MLIKRMKKIFYMQKAFSIIEVVVVIFIVVFGMVGILALAQRSISASNINKNELIASQLAQEGLELVRNKRDENWLAGLPLDGWKYGDGVDPNTDIVGDLNYSIDYLENIYNTNSINDVGARLIIGASGYYSHNTSDAPYINSPFYRIIEVTDDQDDYVEIKCTVRWKERGATQNYSASMILYNWY